MGAFFTELGGKNVPDVTHTEIMLKNKFGMHYSLIDDTFGHIYFIMSFHSNEIAVIDVTLLT